MTVLALAPAPTVAEEIRAHVVEVLERALAEAKDGQITSVVVIARHPDGEFSDWHSSTAEAHAVIGSLEVAKALRIKQLLDD